MRCVIGVLRHGQSCRGMKRSFLDFRLQGSSGSGSNPGTPAGKRKAEELEEEEEEPKDDIRLYEEGWKGRYYLHKFGVDSADDDYHKFRKQVVSCLSSVSNRIVEFVPNSCCASFCTGSRFPLFLNILLYALFLKKTLKPEHCHRHRERFYMQLKL